MTRPIHLGKAAGGQQEPETRFTSGTTCRVWRGSAGRASPPGGRVFGAGQIKAALGISGVHAEVYSWQVKSGDTGEAGAQVDLLLDRRDGIVNLCEMKYVNGVYSIGKVESMKLKNRVESFRKLVSMEERIELRQKTDCAGVAVDGKPV